MAGTQVAGRGSSRAVKFPQPDADLKTLKLSSGGARYAWFTRAWVRQTKGRWGSGYGPDGLLGAPLTLEWVQLQVISEGLKTKPSQWLTVKRDDPKLWDKIGEWVGGEKFGSVGGPRVYREWYIQTSKKSGKSTLSSSLGIYFTGYDGEPGAEVYALAASKTNAKTVFDQARFMILKSPRLMDEFKVYKDVIEHERSGSIFRVLAADADYNEGFNPHAVIIDELHVHKSREMYDALTSHLHTGAREDPIAITITNAGDDEESICYEVYSQGRAVIDGLPDARTDLYAWIPELEPSEIYDPSKWKKVMPMSWQTVPAMQEAQRKFPEYVFLRRYLNVWTEAELGWLPYEFWADAEEKDIVVPKVPIILAADMGMTKDTTALAWAGVVEECTCGVGSEERDPTEHYEDCHFGEVVVGSHIWGIKQRDRAKSPPCHELLKGDRFPIKLLRNYVEDVIRPEWEIIEFVYDKWMMEQLAQDLSDEGLNMSEFPQCIAPETLVTLANGTPVKAAALVVGDVVLGQNNEPGNVLTIAQQTLAPCCRITTNSGRQLTVTRNHPFLVQRRYTDGRREQWVQASDLRPGPTGDRILLALDYLSDETSHGDSEVSHVEAWALGLFLGDGHLSKGRLAVTTPEFIPPLEDLFGGALAVGRGYVDPPGARIWLRSHGLGTERAWEKRVPDHVFTLSRSLQAAFIAGFLDADGTVRNPGPSGQVGAHWTSTSRGLLEDVQHMLAGIGIPAVIRARTAVEPRPAWDLIVGSRGSCARMLNELGPHIRHPRKLERLIRTGEITSTDTWFERKKTDPIVSIEMLPDLPTIGLSISHGTHITAGLVSHNTDQRMIPASEDLWNVITRDDLLRHPGDPVLTKHVMAGVVDETPRGWRINKRKTKKPCDGLIAMLMATHRALHYFRTGTPGFEML